MEANVSYQKAEEDIRALTGIEVSRSTLQRLVQRQDWQEEEHSIGSGQVESLVKPIGLQVRLTGAQWLAQNVPKVLKHLCAYLNAAFPF